MKTSAVLASLLFGSFAVAAPVDKRALVYKTEVLTETIVIYTTVYDDEPVAEATTTPAGYFYEQPKAPSTTAAQPTSAPALVPEQKPSSSAPSAPAYTPAPAPVASPSPAPEQPKPVEDPKPSSTYVAPAPVAPISTPTPAAPAPPPAATSSAPAPSYPSNGGSSTGETYSGVDITIYDNSGGFGACGTALHDTDMIVALAQPAWGKSTYDVMTGAATNPWCGQKIKVDYQGNSIEATIMDLCPGCSGHDIDLSLAAWKALTGKDEKTRLKASWSKIS